MATFNFDFNLESAAFEIESAMNLLNIYNEFINNEMPAEGSDKREVLAFVQRVREYQSLVEAASDKVSTMHETMKTAIYKFFAEAKKEATV